MVGSSSQIPKRLEDPGANGDQLQQLASNFEGQLKGIRGTVGITNEKAARIFVTELHDFTSLLVFTQVMRAYIDVLVHLKDKHSHCNATRWIVESYRNFTDAVLTPEGNWIQTHVTVSRSVVMTAYQAGYCDQGHFGVAIQRLVLCHIMGSQGRADKFHHLSVYKVTTDEVRSISANGQTLLGLVFAVHKVLTWGLIHLGAKGLLTLFQMVRWWLWLDYWKWAFSLFHLVLWGVHRVRLLQSHPSGQGYGEGGSIVMVLWCPLSSFGFWNPVEV